MKISLTDPAIDSAWRNASVPGPKRIYVIGPVTGIPEGNRPLFEAAREKLGDEGWEVELPHDTIAPDAEWRAAMRQSITRMLANDVVAALPGWQQSRGAALERSLALAVGMPVLDLGDGSVMCA